MTVVLTAVSLMWDVCVPMVYRVVLAAESLMWDICVPLVYRIVLAAESLMWDVCVPLVYHVVLAAESLIWDVCVPLVYRVPPVNNACCNLISGLKTWRVAAYTLMKELGCTALGRWLRSPHHTNQPVTKYFTVLV